MVSTLSGERVEHRLLVLLRSQLKKRELRQAIEAFFALECLRQRQPMLLIRRIVRLKLPIAPKCLEMGFCLLEKIPLAVLGEFHRPLQSAQQGRRREVCTSDVGRAKAGLAMKHPCLRVQATAAAIERHTHLATREPSQHVERLHLRRTSIGCGENADPDRPPPGIRATSGAFEQIEHLSYARYRDEADQQIDLIAVAALGPQLAEKTRIPFGCGEKPRMG